MTAEEAIKKIRNLIPASPQTGVDDRIRHIEEYGDPDGLGPEDVCDIIEKLYIEQWHAIDEIVMAVESAQQGVAAELPTTCKCGEASIEMAKSIKFVLEEMKGKDTLGEFDTTNVFMNLMQVRDYADAVLNANPPNKALHPN